MMDKTSRRERRRQTRVFYHPIVELGSQRRVGAEAVLPPSMPVGGTVMRQACLEAANWPSGRLGINIEPASLQDGLVLRHLAAALDESGLTPERLDLELAEPVLSDIDLDSLLTLSVVRDFGVGVVLDGFGTGGASLRMLKRLPLTGLKLDASLVREAASGDEDAALVRAVVAACQALGLPVTACGLDSLDQCAVLSACGCATGQGRLFSEPASACGEPAAA